MNWKNRLTNYNFWISIFSAVLLILQALKIEFDIAYVNEIFTAVLGLLVVIGIISDPTRTTIKTPYQTTEKKEKQEIDQNNAISDLQPSNKEVNQEDEVIEKPLPIVEKDEADISYSKNDFQNVLSKISEDLNVKIKELATLNKETAERLIQLQHKDCDENIKIEIQTKDNDNQPAAAEMENPYFDLMK